MKMKYELDQVAIRMVKEPPLMSDHPIRGPEDAIDILADAFCDLDREVLAVVNLRTDGKPINMNIMSIGTINCTIAVPREALKTSVLSNASSILLVHNHRSGNLVPSGDDIRMTDQMIKAYELLGIRVLDHIIIAPDRSYYSMREQAVFETGVNTYSSRLEDLEFFKSNKQSEGRNR
jgi:DNA repair protein RadC